MRRKRSSIRMPLPNPDHLLDQVDRLVAPPAGGAPRQTDLRRAISSAYYALFHALATEAADGLAGARHRQSPGYALIYRSVGHRSLRALCDNVSKASLPAKYSKYAPKGGFGGDLEAVASALVDLQDKRHLADYDPTFKARTSDAFLAVATARDALSRFRRASRQSRRAFVSLAAFSPR